MVYNYFHFFFTHTNHFAASMNTGLIPANNIQTHIHKHTHPVISSALVTDVFKCWFPQQEDWDRTQSQHHQDLLHYTLHTRRIEDKRSLASHDNVLCLQVVAYLPHRLFTWMIKIFPKHAIVSGGCQMLLIFTFQAFNGLKLIWSKSTYLY